MAPLKMSISFSKASRTSVGASCTAATNCSNWVSVRSSRTRASKTWVASSAVTVARTSALSATAVACSEVMVGRMTGRVVVVVGGTVVVVVLVVVVVVLLTTGIVVVEVVDVELVVVGWTVVVVAGTVVLVVVEEVVVVDVVDVVDVVVVVGGTVVVVVGGSVEVVVVDVEVVVGGSVLVVVLVVVVVVDVVDVVDVLVVDVDEVVVVGSSVVDVVLAGSPLKLSSYCSFHPLPPRQTSGCQQHVPARRRYRPGCTSMEMYDCKPKWSSTLTSKVPCSSYSHS